MTYCIEFFGSGSVCSIYICVSVFHCWSCYGYIGCCWKVIFGFGFFLLLLMATAFSFDISVVKNVFPQYKVITSIPFF